MDPVAAAGRGADRRRRRLSGKDAASSCAEAAPGEGRITSGRRAAGQCVGDAIGSYHDVRFLPCAARAARRDGGSWIAAGSAAEDGSRASQGRGGSFALAANGVEFAGWSDGAGKPTGGAGQGSTGD